MSIVLLNSLTVFLYSLAAAMQFLVRTRFTTWMKFLIMGCAVVAIYCHATLLHLAIDTGQGQNLSPGNMLSLASWLIVLLFLVLALAKPISQLGILLFPIAAISIILAYLMPSTHIVTTVNDFRQLVHILLAIVTFSILSLAGLLAMLLSLQDRRLRNNTLTGWMSRLPPLETMETLLFDMVAAGFFLLTLLLCSSFYFYHAELWRMFWSKVLVATSAWIIFAVLILGRKLMGWRGRKAVYCTLFGLSLVFTLYFGSFVIKGLS